MKNTVLALTSATLFGFAATAQAAPEFFVGAQAGYQNVDLEETDRSENSNFSRSATADFSVSGATGGIFAGVKFNVTPRFYLSPEVNLGTSNSDGGVTTSESYDFSSGNITNTGGSSESYEYEAGRSYGLGVLAGYNLTEATSFYGRLGYQRTKFKASYNYDESYNYVDGNFGFSDSGSFSDSDSDSKTFGGVRFGVGMETAISSNVALRVDWSQTHYSSETFNYGGGESTTFDPTENQFQVGVSYRF